MKRFIYIFSFLGFIFLFITGCSNYNEINNVMIVDSIGIDKNNNHYIVSFNTYIGNDKYETYDVRVKDLDTSFNEIYLLVNKKIYLSHLNILYLSSTLTNSDIFNIVNTFNNRDDLRGSFLVTMVNNYDKDIFKTRNISALLNNNYKESGYIFCNKRGERLTTRGVAHQLKELAIKYKMNPNVVYPHSFRHRFAKNFLDKYNDLALLADLMGHESIETTRIYLRRTSEEQQEIINKVITW